MLKNLLIFHKPENCWLIVQNWMNIYLKILLKLLLRLVNYQGVYEKIWKLKMQMKCFIRIAMIWEAWLDCMKAIEQLSMTLWQHLVTAVSVFKTNSISKHNSVFKTISISMKSLKVKICHSILFMPTWGKPLSYF